MKKLYPLWVCLMLVAVSATANLTAQSINLAYTEGATSYSGVMRLDENSGTSARNRYVLEVGAEEVSIYWDNEWILEQVDLFTLEATTVASSQAETGENPPNLVFGNWQVEAGFNLTQLEGSGTVDSPPPFTATITDQQNIACSGGSNGSLTVTVTNGTAPYAYTWSNGASVTNTPSATNTISGLPAGTYSVTVTDAGNEQATTSVDLTESMVLTATVTATDVSCNGAFDGSAMVTPSGGTGPFDYHWEAGAESASITFLAPGDYPVTVTDANGCTVETSATVGEPDALQLTTTSTGVECRGESNGLASVTVTGGDGTYSYAWTNDANNCDDAPGCNPVISDQPSAGDLAAGSYTVRITDGNDCTQSARVQVTEPAAALEASAQVVTDVSCNGGADGVVSVTATGGTVDYTYQWSNGATTPSAGELVAGTYTVTVTDANGCTTTATTTVAEPPVLTLSATATASVSCFDGRNGSAAAGAEGGTGAYTYLWSNGQTTGEITEVSAGSYGVTVTDENNCTATATVVITQPAPLEGSIRVDSTVTCYGDSNGGLTVMVQGGVGSYSYIWSDKAKSTTDHVTGVPGGAYTVRIVDENECAALAFGSVAEPDSLVIDTLMVKDSGAGDGQAIAVVVGGTAPYAYAWNTDPVVENDTLSGLTPGQYAVAVSDANACTAVASVTVAGMLPGEQCILAIGIDSLLNGPLDSVLTMAAIDNSDYPSVAAGEGLVADCYAAADSLYHPVFFRFTGDGNMYRVRAQAGTGDAAIVDGDTRAMLLSGTCNATTMVACGDDASDTDRQAMLEFRTEAGMEYLLVVDGGSEAAMGEYTLQASRFITTSVTETAPQSVFVYPNPTTGKFRVDGVDVQSVEVYDGYGRRVAVREGIGAEVDIRELPRGVYTLRILDREQMMYSARVVKQ